MDEGWPMAYCRKDMNLKHPVGECPHDQEERGMDELTAFVSARLDEDEAMAAAACVTAPPPWKSADRESDYRIVTDAEGNAVVYYEGTPTLEEAAHIARHDPARVLREVQAKRRIAEDYRITAGACQRVTGAEIDTVGYRAMCAGRDALKSCVTQIAAVWSDHPDYRAEWASAPA